MASRDRPMRGTSPPGASSPMLSTASSLMIVSALVVTLLLFVLTLELLRRNLNLESNQATQIVAFQVPSFLVALIFAREAGRKRELCFSLRACAWLPVLHLGLLFGVQAIWTYISSRQEGDEPVWKFQLAEQLPGWAILLLAASFLLAALVWSTSQRAERRLLPWLRPLIVLLVAFLLALGLWLPLVCKHYAAFETPYVWTAETLVLRERFVWLVLLPPAIFATALAMLSGRRLVRRAMSNRVLQSLAQAALLFVLVAGVIARVGATKGQALAYANFIPIMLYAAALCMLCIATMALAHSQTLRQIQAVSRRPAPWRQEGEVSSSPETGPPASVHFLGWLQGLHMETSSFVLTTSAGDIPIPPGSQLIAPIPLWTANAAAGSNRAILRRGDRVTASGFVSPTGGEGAYRSSTVPIVGSKGIVVVMNNGKAWDIWREITLATWRPTLLYLAAGAIVVIPGLAGFFVW